MSITEQPGWLIIHADYTAAQTLVLMAIAYASEAPTTMEIEDLLRDKLQCMGNYTANTVPDLVLKLESLGAIQKCQEVEDDYREATDYVSYRLNAPVLAMNARPEYLVSIGGYADHSLHRLA